MLEILFFAIIAYIIFKKLISVLGDTRYDVDVTKDNKAFEDLKNSLASFMEKKPPVNANEISMASGLEASFSEEERKIFDQIRRYDEGFIAEKFVKNAKSAFKIILESFAKGDKTHLKELCNKDIYNEFVAQIDSRVSQSQLFDLTIVSIKDAVITSISKNDSEVFIKVKIVSEQIKAIKDKISGEIISGSSSKVITVKDHWTFVRQINSSSKVWRLVSVDENEG